MKQFEHKMVVSNTISIDDLNQLGQEGWGLVQILPTSPNGLVYLKREISPWISVEERMPEIINQHESEDCIIAIVGRNILNSEVSYMTGFYDCDCRDWYIYGSGYSILNNLRITHWKLLEKLPKGGAQ